VALILICLSVTIETVREHNEKVKESKSYFEDLDESEREEIEEEEEELSFFLEEGEWA
jgi:hypothetical protein